MEQEKGALSERYITKSDLVDKLIKCTPHNRPNSPSVKNWQVASFSYCPWTTSYTLNLLLNILLTYKGCLEKNFLPNDQAIMTLVRGKGLYHIPSCRSELVKFKPHFFLCIFRIPVEY